jgi:hypothetical protein
MASRVRTPLCCAAAGASAAGGRPACAPGADAVRRGRSMVTFYWFALVVGGGLLALSLLGDLFGGDAPADVETPLDSPLFGILSLRTATYALFGFGATGLLLGRVWGAPLGVAAAATAVGLASGGLAAATFGWLRRTQSGELSDDLSLVGRPGRVMLPIGTDRPGKILVARGGREIELLALPFDREPDAPEAWTSVVIVDMTGGTARVAPYNDALAEDGSSVLPPAIPEDGT